MTHASLLGAAARQQGMFKDADTGLAKMLYGLLDEDQMTVAAANNLDGVLKSAQAAVKLRKGCGRRPDVACSGSSLIQALLDR
jgi:hypothetical protein